MSTATQPLLTQILDKIADVLKKPPCEVKLIAIWLDVLANIVTENPNNTENDLGVLGYLASANTFNSLSLLLDSYETNPRVVFKVLVVIKKALSREDSFSLQAREMIL